MKKNHKTLEGKKILIGITGSIAVYKIAMLTRFFVKEGAEVQIIMTEGAKSFVQPLTFSTLSKNPVHSKFVPSEGALWTNHVELGLWADLMIIAPATANTMAKMAQGLCNNLLTAVYLSAKCPVMFAPAMDLDMWHHPATQNNIKLLTSFGNLMIPVGSGELASGLVGEGRLAEPEEILEFVRRHFDKTGEAAATGAQDSNLDKPLKGKKVLISAGPTQESLDPVRFISNHSSGRMGIALAESAAKRGAEVHLVLGPTSLRPENPEIQVHPVKSAEDMYQAVTGQFDNADYSIMAAAVADFTPLSHSETKIKKSGKDNMILELKRTKDILKHLGTIKKENQLLIGFALETNNEIENAKRKLNGKNLDLIVLNSMRQKGAGFQHNTNKITILDRNTKITHFELKSKTEVAEDIWDSILAFQA